MLANASISQADVSKAKPQRGPAGHRGTRTPAGGRIGGPASGDVGVGDAAYRLQEWSSGIAEEEMRHIGEMRVSEGRTLAWLISPAAGDGDARVSGRSGASGRRGASERSLSSGTGAARRGGGDDNGGREERR
jgi:hypothetical protein